MPDNLPTLLQQLRVMAERVNALHAQRLECAADHWLYEKAAFDDSPTLSTALLALLPVVERFHHARNMACQDIGLQMKADREADEALSTLPAALSEALKP